jgi:hypothetical protein
MENNNIQFHYMQDEEVPQRVLTLATQKTAQDIFKVVYAVNRVDLVESSGSYIDPETGMTVEYVRDSIVYDPFNKSLARKIARGRLNSDHVVIVNVKPNNSVRRSVLEALASSLEVPDVVSKIAQQRLDLFDAEDFSGKGTD